jgi:hypothetical protein
MPTLRQKFLAGYILATPVLQAASFVLFPAMLAIGFVVHAPLAVALVMFSPLLPLSITVLTQLYGLSEFARQYGKRASIWHYASVVFLTPLYQVVLSCAAVVACYKYVTGDTSWYKTGRAASHREVSEELYQGAAA